LVRFSIGKISADMAQSDQAFLDDRVKSWETSRINTVRE